MSGSFGFQMPTKKTANQDANVWPSNDLAHFRSSFGLNA